MRLRRNLLGLFLFIILLAAVDLWGIHLFRRNGIPLRFQEASAAEMDHLGRDGSLVSAPDSAYFRAQAIAGGVSAALSGEALVRAVLRWTMDQVSVAGHGVSRPRPSARDQLAFARAGGGLHCAQMADLFVETLRGFGVTARVVTTMSSLSTGILLDGTSSHATVEVLLDGRWIVFDPTFHVSYRTDGRLLGASEVREALLAGEIHDVEPVFYGEVAYPARLESYPGWEEYFRHVLVPREHDPRIWNDLPPQRYWMGARYFHLPNEGARRLNALYFTFFAAIPAVLVLLALALAWGMLPRSVPAIPPGPHRRPGSGRSRVSVRRLPALPSLGERAA